MLYIYSRYSLTKNIYLDLPSFNLPIGFFFVSETPPLSADFRPNSPNALIVPGYPTCTRKLWYSWRQTAGNFLLASPVREFKRWPSLDDSKTHQITAGMHSPTASVRPHIWTGRRWYVYISIFLVKICSSYAIAAIINSKHLFEYTVFHNFPSPPCDCWWEIRLSRICGHEAE